MKKFRIGGGLRLGVLAVLLFSSSMLFSFVVAGKLAEDIWKRLGINRQEGMEKVKESFISGYLHHEGVSNVKNLALSDRAAVAKDLLTFSKQYLASPTFKVEYDKMRTASHPIEPTDHTQTKEQVRQKEIDEIKKAIVNMEAVGKTLPADQQKNFQASIEMYRKTIKDYQDPNNKIIDGMYRNQLDQRQRDLNHFKEEMKRWETEYPADVKLFVKGRLQHYLDVAGTVDFSAALVEKYGKKRFVNPVYQSKNDEWKMIFRAGKDVYEQTKVFAEQWIKELQ
ncbi:hypothetical protein Q4E93_30150 [Flavitalea sp. BT771]|uniref:hypothetical protein n=1 Tax=Flavitalea sp. BT771 TaxID=3063329 RepID=UPI0026E3CF8E|nr:hypothetical protein [Flavitalea sp. BT771]MDO6434914.1 hypothetical protein [Flavitalea sp. BT771]MDV6223814.1 hypothetical protein [Flavitalea sp. BT771]